MLDYSQPHRRHLPWLCLALLLLLGATCGAQAKTRAVKVLYAGSLTHLMQEGIGPAFHATTGADFQGIPGGSTGLANAIRGKIRQGDIFLSANPDVNQRLTGKENGQWVSWYITFMQSPLVIGYNPKSHFAQTLKTKPWYKVITQPGFHLGRTDEEIDPKGAFTVEAIDQIAAKQKQPELKTKILKNAKVFPEQTLVGRLQAGQLDAGFFYKGEAVAAGIPTVNINPVTIGATYTMTILNKADNPQGAADFIRFLLSPEGKAIVKKNGFDLMPSAKLSGDLSAVPDTIQSLVNP